MTDKITYKEPLYIWVWLRTALKMEQRKYAAAPVTPDMVPEHELAEAWGYVVAGYFLIEQGLKAIPNIRGGKPLRIHALSTLFAELCAEDQDILRAYYDDFCHAYPGMSSFPLVTLDEFLVNLDGAQDGQGQCSGSFDWRYFPTQVGSGLPMPCVSIHVMHEIVYGCVQLVRSIDKGDDKAGGATYSWRLHRERQKRYHDWLIVRMNSPGWGQEGDRIEILWGPDYNDRYDYLVFKGDRRWSCFAPLPNVEETGFAVIDKRDELESFNPEEALQGIGITASQ